jgi:hypothetical protein
MKQSRQRFLLDDIFPSIVAKVPDPNAEKHRRKNVQGIPSLFFVNRLTSLDVPEEIV